MHHALRSVCFLFVAALALVAIAKEPRPASSTASSPKDAQPAARYVPGAKWEKLADPAKLGWSLEKLKAARDYTKTIDTTAVMIVVDGHVLDQWGDVERQTKIHSCRKSFMSALYGIYVSEGKINLDKTMADLGIDDNEPKLTDVEKKATVRDLLKARSGVYHPALYETPSMKVARPERYSHAPGEFWYYNNWDFNVLGTIFAQETKQDFFTELKKRILDPIGFQDFRQQQDGQYFHGPDSIHPAYPMWMSARDMARFGLLFLHDGRWGDKQIVPSEWVKESTTAYSDYGSGGYGYLWWVAVKEKHFAGVELPEGSYSARGNRGQYILVIPPLDLVIVHRVNTDKDGPEVSGEQFGKLVKLILAAHKK